jgi:hypothetical protein
VSGGSSWAGAGGPRRSRRSSPALREELIPPLYHLARARGVPMTVLASEIVAAYLTAHAPAPDREATPAGAEGGAAR